MDATKAQMQAYSRSVLDVDGSCRDINFEGLTWAGATSIMQWLIDNSANVTADNEEKKPIESLQTGKRVCDIARTTGVCHISLRDTDGLFSQTQAFICPDSDFAFVELSFFPEDIISDQYSLERLVAFLDNLKMIGRAANYFVRYENASWRVGDTSNDSGVIFTFHDIEHLLSGVRKK